MKTMLAGMAALVLGSMALASDLSPVSVSPRAETERAVSAGKPADWPDAVRSFVLAGRADGYVKTEAFLAFLDRAESGAGPKKDRLSDMVERRGLWIIMLVIPLWGLALNLTPCVLPMIPVNLAIIGAGSQAGSRRRGFALGGVYGAGIAMVYGALGVVVLLTGARFGALNSSPWFNLIIAAVFAALSLAMFGVFDLDFSRFQGRAATGKHATFTAAFIMGGVAALLAGACVAPVVISVLFQSAKLYSEGSPAALLLPFLLGLGMALPWPFAGAGLSFLPKPGPWMVKVKYAFGLFILLVGFWYARLGVSLLRARSADSRAAVAAAEAQHSTEEWLTSLDEGLAAALCEGRPVLIDFWASWCKNCLTMEKTTLADPMVIARLRPYVKVKFRAEKLDEPGIKEVLDHFGVIGLPAYVILKPNGRSEGELPAME